MQIFKLCCCILLYAEYSLLFMEKYVPGKLKMFHQRVKFIPAIEFLGMFLPHCVKPVGNGGILSTQQ